MQYRKFGNTGINISALGFGAMRLPEHSINGTSVYDEDKSIQIIQRAFELGVNYIDTAPYYCDGQSERIVGKALKSWRGRVYVSTKNPVEDHLGSHWRERLERSLRKLDVESIDFYHMWGIDWETYEHNINVPDGPLEEAFRAKEEGLIKHLSFSFHDKPENMIRLVDTGYFDSVLCQYNLLDRANERSIAHAAALGLGVAVMGPVGGGRLATPSAAIRSLLSARFYSSAEIALRFVLANTGVHCALSGMSTLEMVEENVRIASDTAPLSNQELVGIERALDDNKKLADLYCTGCRYCMPCPQGVNIPLNFKLMNDHRIYGLTEYARAQYAQIGTQESLPGKKADACVACGLCESKCPQSIEIRRQLKETDAVLGAAGSERT